MMPSKNTEAKKRTSLSTPFPRPVIDADVADSGIGSGIRPNCEAFGYVRQNGQCTSMHFSNEKNEKISVPDKVCLCTHLEISKSGLVVIMSTV